MQKFDTDQKNLINKGSVHRKTLRNTIDQALNNNHFNDNFIVSSLPGLGKTWEMEYQLKNLKNAPLVFKGDNGMFGYIIDVATAIYLNGGPDKPLKVINDDCDVLFDDKTINTTKKMFDDTRVLRYGKNYRSIKNLCTPKQWEAIESFARDDRAGLDIDVSNVTFITLTNMHLHDVNEVEKQEQGSPKYTKYNAKYAIRRRTTYKEISMNTMELWGYVADVVLHEKICEKFMPSISEDYKHQILEWLYHKWNNGLTEKNLSIVEKMTKDIVQYPSDYKDIWNQEYVRKQKNVA